VVGHGPLRRFEIEVERGLKIDRTKFASQVQRILFDPRGWTGRGHLALQRVNSGVVDLRVTLASPATVDKLCFPLPTAGVADCFNRGRAVINYNRWTLGSASYAGDLRDYRYYLINHEFGHGLGHGHRACPGPGRRSFVMMEQTGTTFGCRRQPWPRGIEQRKAVVPLLVLVLEGPGEPAAEGGRIVRALGAVDRRLKVRIYHGLRALSVKRLKDAGAVVAIGTGGMAPPKKRARRELLAFLHEEGGLVAVGSATRRLRRWPQWAKMLGVSGAPVPVPAGADVRVRLRHEPATMLVPPDFASPDPIFAVGSRVKAKVVASLARTREPVAWCRKEGAGHVFADAIGDGATSWTGASQQALVAGGLAWALELANGDHCPD
jgi:type 1 glutamine amidotransferase